VEDERRRHPLVRGEERGVLGTGRVHHRADVVHPRFKCGYIAQPIGQTHCSLVEHHDPRELRQPLDAHFPETTEQNC